MQNPEDILAERRWKWTRKAILRKLYFKWYGQITGALKPGTILELGGGSGNLKDSLPHVISSDILYAPWLDAVLDAHKLPFKDESVHNIVLFDVLHHLEVPALFFLEANRILRPEGRIVLVEPYVSWASFFVYRFLHAEDMDWYVNPLSLKRSGNKENPFHSNQAVTTLIFEKFRSQFMARFPRLRILREERTDPLLYPLSGGFHNPSLCPPFLWRPLEHLEDLLAPFHRFLAFRLFVVLEKSG